MICHDHHMENNKSHLTAIRMFVTAAEAKAKGLPSVQEQIERHNRAILTACSHDRLNEDGICRKCGSDQRGTKALS